MTFETASFLLLADPQLRTALLGNLGAQNVLDAAYGAGVQHLEPPLTPTFDSFELGVPARLEKVDVSGTLLTQNGERTHLQLEASGLQTARVVADAFWRGAILARASSQDAPIVRVEAVDGPSTPAGVHRKELEIEFAEPDGPATALPVHLPIAVAFVVQRPDESLFEQTARGREVRAAMMRRGLAVAAPRGVKLVHDIVVAHLLPTSFFDADWPLSSSPATTIADRLSYVRSLLVPQGIAVLTH